MNKTTPQGEDPKRQGMADGQTDRLMEPQNKTKFSLAEPGHLHPEYKCPHVQTSFKFSLGSLELLKGAAALSSAWGKVRP